MSEPQSGCPDCLDLTGAEPPRKICSGGIKCFNNLHPNKSGFLPVGYRLLVLPDVIQKRSAGGLYLPEETTGREEMAQVKGTLIAVGDGCWSDTPAAKDYPKPGDRIVFGKYSGLLWNGADGEKYRILNDTDVVGLEVQNAN
jgi:chaperonin GroES